MKCTECKVRYCAYRSTEPQRECPIQNGLKTISTPTESGKVFIVPEGARMVVDWQAFRREAAKDFISGMLANVSPAADQWTTPEIVTAALDIADELIKQLKDEK